MFAMYRDCHSDPDDGGGECHRNFSTWLNIDKADLPRERRMEQFFVDKLIEPLPSNDRTDTHTDTQTDGTDM